MAWKKSGSSVATDGSASILLDHRGYDVNRMYVDLWPTSSALSLAARAEIAADLERGSIAVKSAARQSRRICHHKTNTAGLNHGVG